MTRPCMTTFRIRPSGPLHGRVKVSGATKNAGTQADGRRAARARRHDAAQRAGRRDLDVMIDVLRAIGADVELRPGDELHIDASGALRPEAPYELVTPDAGVGQRARSAAGSLRRGAGRDARRRQHRQSQARHALPRPRCDGREPRRRARVHRARGRRVSPAHGIVLDFPSVGATENLLYRGGARQGRDRDRERGAGAGDHRPRRLAQPHGRAHRRRGHVDDRDRGCRRARARATARSWATASRRARC